MGNRSIGRRFGVEIGIAALVVGALLWRRHQTASVLLLALGAFVGTLGVVLPATLEPVARRWLAVGESLSRILTPVLLGLIYFAIVTPMGVLRRRLGTSPFARRRDAGSYWIQSPQRATEEERSRMERLH